MISEEMIEVKEELKIIRDIKQRILRSYKYARWRLTVIRRDSYTCQKCKKQIFLELHAHHLISIFEILFINKIKTIEEAFNLKELWNIDNGISYCDKCHRKEH